VLNKVESCLAGQLTSNDVQSIKNLILSYKESAAFLHRSAEELDQLINSSCDY
jgi:N-acetylglutamate synthase-like GNAT family acetyltransferase